MTGPELVVRVAVDRPGGWLVGGAGVAGVGARLRRVEVDVRVPVGHPADARVELVLLGASVFGVSRPRWVIDLTARPTAALTPEERLLLGEFARSLGAVPTDGPLRGLVDVLTALGIAEEVDGVVQLVIDPLERALAEPATIGTRLATDAARQLIADGIGRLGGVVPGPVSIPGPVTIERAGVAVVITPTGADAGIAVVTTGDGLVVPLGARLGVDVALRFDGSIRADLALAGLVGGPNGRPELTASVDTANPGAAGDGGPVAVGIRLVRDDGTVLDDVALFPTPDVAALADLALAVGPAEVLRLLLGFVRGEAPAFGAVLEVLGFGPPDAPLRLPARLVRDPVGWFADAASLGVAGTGRPDATRIAALVSAFDQVVNAAAPTAGDGAITLAWGLELAVAATPGGGLAAQLAFPDGVQADGVDLRSTLTLVYGTDGILTPNASIGIDLQDPAGGTAPLGGIEVAVGNGSAPVQITARVGATVLPLVPFGTGLGGLAGGAAQRALPLALDALAGLQVGAHDIGGAVGALGDVLGLRTGGRFDAAQLADLAADPGGELLDRVTTDIGATLAALEGIIAPAVGPGVVTVAGTIVTVAPGAHVVVALDLGPVAAGTGGPMGCIRVTDAVPLAGIALSATLCVGDDLGELSVSAEVTSSDLLAGLLPAVSFAVGADAPTPAGRLDVGLWLDPSTPAPTPADPRTGLFLVVDLATGASVVTRTDTGATPADGPVDPLGLVSKLLLPMAADVVLAIDEIGDLLRTTVTGGSDLIGDLLTPHVLEPIAGTGPRRYRTADDLFAIDELPVRILKAAVSTATRLGGSIPIPSLAPMTFGITSDTDTSGVEVVGFTVGIADRAPLVLIDTGDVRLSLEVDPRWVARAEGGDPDTATGGALLLLLTNPPGGAAPSFAPWLQIRGLGLRVDSPTDDKLIDLGVSIRSVGLHGWYERAFSGHAPDQGGGHLEIDQLALPIGGAGGNAVAGSFLSGDDSGDQEDLKPAFSPALSVFTLDGTNVEVDLRAGEGAGPWWLPIQRSFGPLYVDQVGLGVQKHATGSDAGDIASVSFLIDGGASLAGLTLAVDDLEVIVPWATPGQVDTWRLDLAGIALGYEGGGVSVAGGLRKFLRDGRADYIGMLSVNFSVYGLTGIGGYGVFPDPSGGEYASFFLFAAVNAPIGGPPAFFVTGLGGGMGLNRQLVAPTSVDDVAGFPLVAALDPSSDLATRPMEALDLLGATFPPKRGAIWFAAGLNFTSFALVETTAVLSVEIDDGLEINLFGLSRMQLPPAPSPPMAMVELALHARFSSSEAVLSVVAQLTDNSWIINESVRLTGGFAFVIWFDDGQFVFTLGGYSPRFTKPERFPAVDRVGFSWEASSSVVVKGGVYFALTSSCIMAGGTLEAAYTKGKVWARFEAGVHILVSWDPFYYWFQVYVDIEAGVRWKTWLGTVRLDFSFGVDVEIEGPKLRGKATLDLSVVSVTVRFGPSGPVASQADLSWAAFRDNFLLAPAEGGGPRTVLSGTVAEGADQTEVATTGTGGAEPPPLGDGSDADPWRVVPEFSVTVSTRAATRTLSGTPLPAHVANQALALGPMRIGGLQSTLSVVLRHDSRDATPSNDPLADQLDRTPILGTVPEAVWKQIPIEADAEANVLPTCTGVVITATADILPPGAAPPISVEIDRIIEGDIIHPLPFGAEQRVGRTTVVKDLLREVARVDGLVLSEGVTAILEQVFADDSRAVGTADWVSPPQVVSLAEGIADTSRAAVVPVARTIELDPEPVSVSVIEAPVLDGVVTLTGAAVASSVASSVKGSRAVRRPAPTIAGVAATTATPLGASLGQSARAATSAKTVVAAGARPVTRTAGGGGDRVRVLGADPAFRASSVAASKALTGRGSGVAMRSGQGYVWAFADQTHEAEVLPSIELSGTTSRVVAIDAGDRVLADQIVDGSFTVPSGTRRLAVLPGRDDAPTTASATHRNTGWTETDEVVQMGSDTYVATGATIRAMSDATRRRRTTVRTARVRGAAAVTGADVVETTLGPWCTTVIVAMAAGTGGRAGGPDTPELFIAGAASLDGEAGAMVTVGDVGYLVTSVKADAKDPITVSVSPSSNQRVVGVIGSTAPVATIVAALKTDGPAAVAPLTEIHADQTVSMKWKSR